jgi:hypothetical protein
MIVAASGGFVGFVVGVFVVADDWKTFELVRRPGVALGERRVLRGHGPAEGRQVPVGVPRVLRVYVSAHRSVPARPRRVQDGPPAAARVENHAARA